MRRKSKIIHKKRTIIVATVLCLVSALGMAGVYQLEKSKLKEEQPLVNWEEASKDNKTADSLLPNEENRAESFAEEEKRSQAMAQETTLPDNADSKSQDVPTAQSGSEAVIQETPDEASSQQASVNNAVTLNFTQEDKLLWPVNGSIVLDFSMDSSIFFPTLKQYKYNPAIAIQSDVGTEVAAAAAGKIESIEKSDETGLTVTIDIGNNYKTVYGQLEGFALGTGSFVEKGQTIATVAAPSRYYSVEGCNLYFKLLHNGAPIDPVEYFE